MSDDQIPTSPAKWEWPTPIWGGFFLFLMDSLY